MADLLRIATFNLENLDDKPGEEPALAKRIDLMRPQLLAPVVASFELPAG